MNQLYGLHTGLYPCRIRFDLGAQPQIMSQRLNAGGARADVLRQCFFSLHIGMSPFLIERFTLLHGGIQFSGQRMLNGLQLFCGFNVVVCQKSVLRQIGFKPNGIF